MRYSLLVPVAISALLAACAEAPGERAATAAASPALRTALPRPPSVATQVASATNTSLDQAAIRQRANQAELAGNIFAPAGDNAFELLLTLREAAPDQAAYENALLDLMPMADRTIRHAIEQQDLVEAQRIADLLTRFDASSNVSVLAQERLAEATRKTRKTETLAVTEASTPASRSQAVISKTVEAMPARVPPVSAPPAATASPAVNAVAGTEPAMQSAVVAAAQASIPRPASAAQPTTPSLTRSGEVNTDQAERNVSAPTDALVAPVVLRRAAVQYPEQAKRQGQEGFVELDVLVDAAGNPSDIKVVQSQPAGLFDRAAIRAMMRWKFQPATRQGQAVSARTRTVIQFKKS